MRPRSYYHPAGEKGDRNQLQREGGCAEDDGYLIEGHVPLEAIEHLLTERPDAVVLVGADGSLTAWD